MMWVITLFVLGCSTVGYTQPVHCKGDIQCSEGYYCEENANICQECLSCDDLKRDPLPDVSPATCIKSVIDCGACKKGLVVDLHGECVRADARAESAVLPPYVWALIVIGLLLFIVIVFYLLRNRDIFKVLASARTSASVRSQCYRVNASAPDFPPPYNLEGEAPRLNELPSYPPLNNVTQDEESSRPFIKSAWGIPLQQARESSDRQAATVFNPPAYEQNEQPVSSVTELANEGPDPITLHDEDTVESPWTPNTSSNNNNINNNNIVVIKSPSEGADGSDGSGGSGASSSAATVPPLSLDVAVDAPPPPKQRRTLQEPNRNRDSNGNPATSEPSYEHDNRTLPQITLNVQCNNNMVFNRIA